jgi:hypothetical protein
MEIPLVWKSIFCSLTMATLLKFQRLGSIPENSTISCPYTLIISSESVLKILPPPYAKSIFAPAGTQEF